MTDTKICPKCKQEKPLSEYYSDRHRKDGITYLCKSCHAEYRRNVHRANKTKDTNLKRCNRCGMLKPLEEFYKSKYERDGYQRWCKLCKITAVKTVCEPDLVR